MSQYLSEEDKTQEPVALKPKTASKVTILFFFLHILLALSLAFRYFFAKSLLPYSFELDFAQTFPIQNELSQSSFFSLEQLDLRLWPLVGFSFCLWIMIGLFNTSVKKAWIYILLVHAIPLMNIFGIMGSPWTGGVCCWVLAWRCHMKPFRKVYWQALALLSIGVLSYWWSSLNFYLWPWLLFSFFTYLKVNKFNNWIKLSFYAYLIGFQIISLFISDGSKTSESLQFIFKLWPFFLGPVAFIVTAGFFLLWCLKIVFRTDRSSKVTKELGILCFLMISAIFMHSYSTDSSIEALITLAFLIPFGLLYGPSTRIERWSVNLSYWTGLTTIFLVLLAPTLKDYLNQSKFKTNLWAFESWHLKERMSQDLSTRFWDAIEQYQPSVILCENKEMALQMERHSDKTCLSIEEWKNNQERFKDLDYDKVFILSKEEIPLSQRHEWFGRDRDWFLHKQWTLTLNFEDIYTFYVYGSSDTKSSPLVF